MQIRVDEIMLRWSPLYLERGVRESEYKGGVLASSARVIRSFPRNVYREKVNTRIED